MDYMSVPVIDGGSLAYERSGVSVAAAAGRTVDLWNGSGGSSGALTAAQVKYRTDRLRAAAGFQGGSYRGIKRREVPAGLTVNLSGQFQLEAYSGYDFEFKELSRAGLSLSWHASGRNMSLAVSQWRNPFDQMYLLDKGRSLDYWGLHSEPAPSTFNDARLAGFVSRGGWGFRGTFGVMSGVRSGWTSSGFVTSPSFLGLFRANVGAQGMKSDFVEFYSLDAAIMAQAGSVTLQIQSQTRNYNWRPSASGLHITDNYSELSAEYPIGRHLYLNAAAGGFIRTLGNEGFKPQAELRLIARL